jgi:hypothetical protein
MRVCACDHLSLHRSFRLSFYFHLAPLTTTHPPTSAFFIPAAVESFYHPEVLPPVSFVPLKSLPSPSSLSPSLPNNLRSATVFFTPMNPLSCVQLRWRFPPPIHTITTPFPGFEVRALIFHTAPNLAYKPLNLAKARMEMVPGGRLQLGAPKNGAGMNPYNIGKHNTHCGSPIICVNAYPKHSLAFIVYISMHIHTLRHPNTMNKYIP